MPTRQIVAPLLRQIQRQPSGNVPRAPTACTLTVIWQLPILPSVPEYWRFTPGECLPSLTIPVSSTTHAKTPISGATRSAHARTSNAASQGESAKNCCTDSYRAGDSPNRNNVGCKLLRPPRSTSPRTYTSAFSRCRASDNPPATSPTNTTRRSRTSLAGVSIATATSILPPLER